MNTHNVGELRYLTFESFNPQLVSHAIFTRSGGFSQGAYSSFNLGGTNGDDPAAVAKNHDLLFKAIARPFDSRFDVWQVHGDHIEFTDRPRPISQKHPPADGIFTQNPDVTLMMRFADCVPLVFHDPVQKAVGIVHGGWQGTWLKIAGVAVRDLVERYGSKPEDLVVGLGPAICGECYQVGKEIKTKFINTWGKAAESFFNETAEGLFLDLWAANDYALREAGVLKIEHSHLCTAENLLDWFSYRKERGVTGRFAVVIALNRESSR